MAVSRHVPRVKNDRRMRPSNEKPTFSSTRREAALAGWVSAWIRPMSLCRNR